MTDELIKQATARAAILHASAAWGSDEDGHLIDRMIDRIEELESWKAAEDAHHRMLRMRIARLREALNAAHYYIDASEQELRGDGYTRGEALSLARDLRAALGETQ